MNSINTNISALAAQQSMQKQNNELSDAMGRLSTGLRINSAADDAAGSAIASKMESQVRSLDVAIRNSYDAISMTQTAEGALGEMENILQRTRELAVQAGNSTLTNSDRSMIQKELDALVSELDSIATKTNFNGVKLLDGSNSTLSFQVGINKGDALNVSLEASGSKALGLEANRTVNEYTSGRVERFDYNTANLVAADVQINKSNALSATFSTDLTTANTATNGAEAIKDAINLNSSVHGATASAFNSLTSSFKAEFAMTDSFSINGAAISISTSSSALVDNINREATGVTASLNANNTITLENNTGEDIVILDAAGQGATDVGFNVSGGDGAITAGTVYSGFLSIKNNDGSAVQIEANNNANGFSTNLGTINDVSRLGYNQVNNDKSITSGSVSGAAILTSTDVKINDVAIGTSVGSSAASKAIAVNAVSDQTLVTASASNEIIVSVDLDAEPVSGANATSTFAYGTPSNVMTFSDGTNSTSAASLSALVTNINNFSNQGYIATADGTSLVLTAGTSTATGQAFGTESFTANNGAVKETQTLTLPANNDGAYAYSKMILSNGIESFEVQITADDATPDNTELADLLIAQNPFSSDIVLTKDSDGTVLTITAQTAGTAIAGSYTLQVMEAPNAATATLGAGSLTIKSTATTETDIMTVELTTDGDGSSGAMAIPATGGMLEIVASGNAGSKTIAVEFESTLAATIVKLQDAINADTTVTFTADIDGAGDLTLTSDEVAATAILTAATVVVNTYTYVDNAAVSGVAGVANAATAQTASTTAAVTASVFSINGSSIDLTAADELSDVVSAINTAAIGDLEASATTDGRLLITSVGGDNIALRDTSTGFVTAVTDATSSAVDISTRATSIGSATGIAAYGTLNLKSSGEGIIKVSGINEDVLGLAAQAETQTLVSGGIKVSTLTNATQALEDIDKAIEKISSFRSSFGAVENRIDASINNLTTLKVNTEAAKSRIEDADFAAETSKMTKSQILSQAATSMLDQANASKQNLLALLQG